MSGITQMPTGAGSDNITRLRFRRSVIDRPAPDVVARQSRIALLAFQAFDDRDTARAFLNDGHTGLGGRPIELAGTSDAGFAAVEAALLSRSGTQSA